MSDRTVEAARALLAGERRGVRGYIAFAGPAVVASIAYMDPGNFATNIQAGAKYGYQLLWVVLAANIIAMLFQALSAKLGIVTGRNLAEMCREQFSLPVAIAMWIVSEIAAMATDLAEFVGAAIGLSLLLGMPLLWGMVATRRTQRGMVKPTNPCMIIWPAMVPTADEDRPEAKSEIRKTTAAPPPSRGPRVR